MRYFKVLAGTHSEGDKSYGQGEIVESEYDLCQLFVNKFEEVADENGTAKPKTSARLAGKFKRETETTKLTATAQERQEDRDKRSGTGTVGQRKTLSAGRGTATEKGDETTLDNPLEEDEEGTTGSTFGEDVTDEFDHAEDGGFKVFRNDEGTYTLVNQDDPERTLEEARTKKEIMSALKKQSK